MVYFSDFSSSYSYHHLSMNRVFSSSLSSLKNCQLHFCSCSCRQSHSLPITIISNQSSDPIDLVNNLRLGAKGARFEFGS